jgi:uncharacterized damage-inducible protein DinB
MRITEMDTLFNYKWWATSKVLDAASGMSDEEFARTDIVQLPHESFRGTLVHMLDLERSARFRLSRNQSSEPINQSRFSTVSELAKAMHGEATAMKDFLIGLEDEHMDSVVVLDDGSRWAYWKILLHVVNHSTQHRSEAAVLLSVLARSPGDLDLHLFLKEG